MCSDCRGRCYLSWFNQITRNPHIDVALLVDNGGRLVATSNRIGSEAQRVASMIKAAEVLARGLSNALGRGEMHSLQLSTRQGHLLVVPVGAIHYLIVLTSRDAPLELIFSYMHRLLERMPEDEIATALREDSSGASVVQAHEQPVAEKSPLDDIDVSELIEAVADWLHKGGDSATDQ